MDVWIGIAVALVIAMTCRQYGMHLSLLPAFLPGETILYTKRYVMFCSILSLPSYRWSFSLPPLVEHGLVVTDRRVIHVVYLLRLFRSEFSQWYDARDASADDDLILTVETGHYRPAGLCLVIVSKTRKRSLLRSSACRLRLYMRHPETVCDILTSALLERRRQ